jgi:hypothetical protein
VPLSAHFSLFCFRTREKVRIETKAKQNKSAGENTVKNVKGLALKRKSWKR